MTVFVLLEPILEQTEADGLTLDLMCSAPTSIMFLPIRVVGVLETIPAGIHPGLVSSPSQDTRRTYSHAVTLRLDRQSPHRESRKIAADVPKD